MTCNEKSYVMLESTTLESLRNKLCADVFYAIGDIKPIKFQHVSFTGHVTGKTMDYLRQLENPQDDMPFFNNYRYLNLVSLTFIALESFIGDVGRMFCILNGNSYEEFKKLSLESRIRQIINFAHVEGSKASEFYRHGVFQELQEFEHFRNVIFHGGYHKKLDYHRKRKVALTTTQEAEKIVQFSDIPYNCNFVDVLQAFKITICVFECFRYIFPGYDIMPEAFIQFKEKASFMKVSTIYSDFIIPYFNRIKDKHSFCTILDLNYTKLHLQSSIDTKGIIKIYINTGQYDPHFVYNTEKTDYWVETLKHLTRALNSDNTKLTLANYYKN